MEFLQPKFVSFINIGHFCLGHILLNSLSLNFYLKCNFTATAPSLSEIAPLDRRIQFSLTPFRPFVIA